jgi:aminoglycoside 2'-N-acetyltransferase I
MMERLQAEISSRWQVALLSTGRATHFYELLGWERWLGLSYTQVGKVAVPDGEHGGLMVFSRDPSVAPDLTLAVTCEDRSGDAW